MRGHESDVAGEQDDDDQILWDALEDYLQAPGIIANIPLRAPSRYTPEDLRRRSLESPVETAAEVLSRAMNTPRAVDTLLARMHQWQAQSTPERRNVLETAEVLLHRLAPDEASEFRNHLDAHFDQRTRLEIEFADALRAFAAEHYLHELEKAGSESLRVCQLPGLPEGADPSRALPEAFWTIVQQEGFATACPLEWLPLDVDEARGRLLRQLSKALSSAEPGMRSKHRNLADHIVSGIDGWLENARAFRVEADRPLTCCGSTQYVIARRHSSLLLQVFAWC